MDPNALPANFYTPPIRKAIEILSAIAQSPEERQRYEDRVKALRDYRSDMSYARREGECLGLLEAVEMGLQLKFNCAEQQLLEKLKKIDDPARLRIMLQQLREAQSLVELRSLWKIPVTAPA